MRDDELSFDRLDEILLMRYGFTDAGREAIEHLVSTRLLTLLAAEAGLKISPSDLELRVKQLERDLIHSGSARSLAEYLEHEGVSPSVFREHMQLGLIHERLAKAALGIGQDKPLTGEQQTLWLKGELKARDYQAFAPPWKKGVVARCGTIVIHADEFAPHLRQTVDRDEIQELCYTILLAVRMRARMPDLSDTAFTDTVDLEIERRRREAESNPKYAGLKYEALLSAAGLSVSGMRLDPAVQVASLARLWVERRYSEDDLKNTYQADREFHDSRFGEGIEVSIIFLRGTASTSELGTRKLEEADAILKRTAAKIRTYEDFVRQVKSLSDDSASSSRKGSLGFVTRSDPRIAQTIRTATWDAVDSERWQSQSKTAASRLAGPVHTSGGSVLLWLGKRRPAPTWPMMRLMVQQELRRRFVEECLVRHELVTYLDRSE